MILGLAAGGVIPWVSVSTVTVLTGCVSAVAWWTDHRVRRRLWEARAADREGDHPP